MVDATMTVFLDQLLQAGLAAVLLGMNLPLMGMTVQVSAVTHCD